MKSRYEYRNGKHGARIRFPGKNGPSFFVYREEIPEFTGRIKKTAESAGKESWEGEEASRLILENSSGELILRREEKHRTETVSFPASETDKFIRLLEQAGAAADKKTVSIGDSRKLIKTPMGLLLLLVSLMALAAGILMILKYQPGPVMHYDGELSQFEGDPQTLHLSLSETDKKREFSAAISVEGGIVLDPVLFVSNRNFECESDFLPLEEGRSIFFSFTEKNDLWEMLEDGVRPKDQYLFTMTSVTMDGETPPPELLSKDRKEDFIEWYASHSKIRKYYFILSSKKS